MAPPAEATSGDASSRRATRAPAPRPRPRAPAPPAPDFDVDTDVEAVEVHRVRAAAWQPRGRLGRGRRPARRAARRHAPPGPRASAGPGRNRASARRRRARRPRGRARRLRLPVAGDHAHRRHPGHAASPGCAWSGPTGGRPSPGRAAARSGLALLSAAALGAGILLALFTRSGRGAHDVGAGTWVVLAARRREDAMSESLLSRLVADGAITREDADRVASRLARTGGAVDSVLLELHLVPALAPPRDPGPGQRAADGARDRLHRARSAGAAGLPRQGRRAARHRPVRPGRPRALGGHHLPARLEPPRRDRLPALAAPPRPRGAGMARPRARPAALRDARSRSGWSRWAERPGGSGRRGSRLRGGSGEPEAAGSATRAPDWTAEQARQAMAEAAGPDEAIRVALRAARDRFSYAAAFSVRRDTHRRPGRAGARPARAGGLPARRRGPGRARALRAAARDPCAVPGPPAPRPGHRLGPLRPGQGGPANRARRPGLRSGTGWPA